MSKYHDKVNQLKAEIEGLKIKLHQTEFDHKKKKGVLKDREFLAVTFPEDPVPVIFYYSCGLTYCLTASFDPINSSLIYDILTECERYNFSVTGASVNHKRITKQEAMEYL